MMKRLWILLAVLTLIVGSAAALGEGASGDYAQAYQSAIDLMAEGRYTEAAAGFRALQSYAEAPRYAMYCEAVNAGENGYYGDAVRNFNSLTGFLDSSIRASYYAALACETAEEYEEAGKLLQGISMYRDSTRRLMTYPGKIKARDYRLADEAEQAGQLETALSMFKKLSGYKDSAARADAVQEKIHLRDYQAACSLENENKLEEALKAFTALGEYGDSMVRAAAVQEKINARDYQQALDWEAVDELEKAYDAFVALGDYKDSADHVAKLENEVNYRRGMNYIAAAGDQLYKYDSNRPYNLAYEIFTALGDYKDSARKAYDLGLTGFATFKYLDETTAAFQFHDKYGLINFTTNTITRPTWKNVGYQAKNCMLVYNGEKYGLADSDGRILSNCQWEAITSAGNGMMIARRLTQRTVQEKNSYGRVRDVTYYKHLVSLLDSSGRVLISDYNSIGSNVMEKEATNSSYRGTMSTPKFYNGLMRVQNKDGLWGFVNGEGQIVIPCAYKAAHEFANGVAAVKEGLKWGYIDTTGAYMIQPQYSDAQDFNAYGLAEVQSGLQRQWNVIDRSNTLVYFEGNQLSAEEKTAEEPAASESGNLLEEALRAAMSEAVEEVSEAYLYEKLDMINAMTMEMSGMSGEEFFEKECGGNIYMLMEMLGIGL